MGAFASTVSIQPNCISVPLTRNRSRAADAAAASSFATVARAWVFCSAAVARVRQVHDKSLMRPYTTLGSTHRTRMTAPKMPANKLRSPPPPSPLSQKFIINGSQTSWPGVATQYSSLTVSMQCSWLQWLGHQQSAGHGGSPAWRSACEPWKNSSIDSLPSSPPWSPSATIRSGNGYENGSAASAPCLIVTIRLSRSSSAATSVALSIMSPSPSIARQCGSRSRQCPTFVHVWLMRSSAPFHAVPPPTERTGAGAASEAAHSEPSVYASTIALAAGQSISPRP